MGAVGSAFGRNMTPDLPARSVRRARPDPGQPRAARPRAASIPAKSLNLLAAAWIQFQVHDWVNHARDDRSDRKDVWCRCRAGMPPWQNTQGWPAEQDMRIAGNKVMADGPDGYPVSPMPPRPGGTARRSTAPTRRKQQRCAREPQLRSRERLPAGRTQRPRVTGFNESWWLGLSAMHTLFAREHNVICEELQRAYPGWTDERVYQTARLIVSALIAKIHTVEWTPAILATEAIDIGDANWYGPPKDWLTSSASGCSTRIPWRASPRRCRTTTACPTR